MGVHYDSDVVRDGRATIDALRRQLAQRDSRIAELEAKLDAAARLAQDSAEAAGEMVGSKPTANDRALERIKAWCERTSECNTDPMTVVINIINEEAAHD